MQKQNLKRKLLNLIKVSRPGLWVGLPLVFFISLKISGASLDLLSTIMMFWLSFPFCIFLYGINDIYDYESDKINPRKNNLLEGTVVTKDYANSIKIYSLFSVIILLLLSLLTMNFTNMIGTILLVVFSYIYSAPPLRIKTIPVLDSFSNGIIYAFAPILMGFSFGADISALPFKAYLVCIAIAGFHSYSTIMDYSADKKAGDRTIAVVIGKRLAATITFIVFTALFLFANFISPIIKSFMLLGSTISAITIIYPSEKIARLFYKLVFYSGIIAGVVYSIIAFY